MLESQRRFSRRALNHFVLTTRSRIPGGRLGSNAATKSLKHSIQRLEMAFGVGGSQQVVEYETYRAHYHELQQESKTTTKNKPKPVPKHKFRLPQRRRQRRAVVM